MKPIFRSTVAKLVRGVGLVAILVAPGFSGAEDRATLGSTDARFGSLAELSAQWWQRVISIPTSVNPVVDPSGDQCMVGESGPVWLLYGSFGASAIVRNCQVPEGKALFFPIINNVAWNSPNLCGQGAPMSVAELRSAAAPFVDSASNLSVAVDGRPVKNLRRVRSVPFALTMPADNVFVTGCGGPSQSPPGIFSPAVDDGYYVLLDPLPDGRHTLRILATSGTFVVDVTYNLTIVAIALR